jgi:hypothetical protein
MRVVLPSSLVVLVACGSPARPPPLGNQATGAAARPACAPGLRGTVVDGLRQPVIGATVVASGPAHGDADFPTVITDEQGRFAFARLDAQDRLTLYYNDASYDGALPRSCDAVVIAIGEPERPGDALRFTLLPPDQE